MIGSIQLISRNSPQLQDAQRLSRLFQLIILLIGSGFISSALADSQSPSIVNGINTSAISETSVRITWNKPWDNQGIAGYNVYRDGNYYTTTTETRYIDEGAQAGTSHDYQITAFDWSQNFSELSAIASVQTLGSVAPPAPQFDQSNNNNAGADRPAKPFNLSSTILNGNSFRLSWNTPDSPRRITGYNIHRDGAYVTTVASNEFTEGWIEWGKDFSYTVVAIDEQVKFSDPSDPVVVNTATGNSSARQLTNDPAPAANNNPQPAAAANSAVPDGYRLVFSEEFRGNSLDPSKWNSRYRWGPHWIINSEEQFYVDRINDPDFGHNPFSFDGEHLYISAIRTPDWLKPKASWQPYLSGALTTYNKFKMRYGYVEMRAKLPRGKGLWPAFWLLHQHDNDRRPEIDVVELIGDTPNRVFNTYHWVENWAAKRTPSYEVWGPDFSQDFHTYAMKWEPGKITWYLDGEQKHEFVDGNVSWEEMYLLVNLAVGGWWPGSPDYTTPLPATMAVDYIRAYQR